MNRKPYSLYGESNDTITFDHEYPPFLNLDLFYEVLDKQEIAY